MDKKQIEAAIAKHPNERGQVACALRKAVKKDQSKKGR